MKRKLSRCPICQAALIKEDGKKICPSCRIEIVGDTFRHTPANPLDWPIPDKRN